LNYNLFIKFLQQIWFFIDAFVKINYILNKKGSWLMKRVGWGLIALFLMLSSINAFGYTLVVGKIISVNKNTAQIDVLSKMCHGKHAVTVKNPQAIPINLIHKVNFLMQIDKTCSSVIIGKTNRGPE